MRRYVSFSVLMGLVLCLLGCDHATKHLATTRLRGHPPVTLIQGVADLEYTENRDVAFSLLRRVPPPVRTPLIYVGGAAAMALLLLLWGRHRDARAADHAAFALILAGALGNFSDRLLHGHVVDFVHVTHWPVFNAADAFLVAGIALLFISERRRRSAPEAAPGAAPAP